MKIGSNQKQTHATKNKISPEIRKNSILEDKTIGFSMTQSCCRTWLRRRPCDWVLHI